MLIEPLNERHDRKNFICREPDLNRWLAQVARQHKEKGVSSTFVAVSAPGAVEILGNYAISMAELVHPDLPQQHRKRMPDRVARIVEQVGGVGLVVNAKPTAVGYYAQYGFVPMADHPHNLFLTL